MDKYLSDIKNWKRTGKKAYEIWMCMPPLGTKVHNHLEKTDYIVNEKNRFVLSGIDGEQWVVDGNKLARTYTFATGEPITSEALRRKSSAGVLEWTKVKTIPGVMENFACLLPKAKYNFFPVKTAWGSVLYANAPGIKHGDGDYLVCSMTPDGKPNLNDTWVVNGRIFPATYNLQNIQVSEKAKMMTKISPEIPKSICNGASNILNIFKREVKTALKCLSVGDIETEKAIRNGDYSTEYCVRAHMSSIDVGLELECEIQYVKSERYVTLDIHTWGQEDSKIPDWNTLVFAKFNTGSENTENEATFESAMKKIVAATRTFNDITNHAKLSFTNIVAWGIMQQLKRLLIYNKHENCNAIKKINNITYYAEGRGFEVEFVKGSKLPSVIRIDFNEDTGVHDGYIYANVGPGKLKIGAVAWVGNMSGNPNESEVVVPFANLFSDDTVKALSAIVK